MAVDITLIRAYTNGAVYTTSSSAVTATAPTDAGSSLDPDFQEVGAISEDGITESTSQDRTDVFIWQNNTLARRIPGQTTKTWTLAASETNLMTLGVQFAGSTITQTAEGVSIEEKAPGTDIRQWVLHGIDGSDLQRIYVPLGEVTERGDVVWSAAGVTVYEWTLSAYADPSGNFAYRYIASDALAL
ncbi:hypothetical protein FHR83_006715 [Actinoplanes campanulatus]|uniref:Uncharacterized protein n=1 Tax=Actinoplanes campanulatus TaxID=113559 RepID=A0A7W5FHV0_9ACTN|nr:hypothetical protein [Actinoplanes campanulatus]MBB3099009.1 hypothetical protein [Actinoplanes campanulatus]GGN39451.1 hypothetical protein GCM10010109_67410 [Actinoplanes campanulatus]GID40169.1 hypothetical protein Aca09nite_66750 [Actinoplanes campanulatus]